MIGIALGCGLAMWCVLPQVRADLNGVKILGSAEMMFVTSLPFSFVTWLVWLLPASSLFGSGGGETPHWVAYAWMAGTPPLNWGLLGWVVGRWRDRREVARPAGTVFGGER